MSWIVAMPQLVACCADFSISRVLVELSSCITAGSGICLHFFLFKLLFKTEHLWRDWGAYMA